MVRKTQIIIPSIDGDSHKEIWIDVSISAATRSRNYDFPISVIAHSPPFAYVNEEFAYDITDSIFNPFSFTDNISAETKSGDDISRNVRFAIEYLRGPGYIRLLTNMVFELAREI